MCTGCGQRDCAVSFRLKGWIRQLKGLRQEFLMESAHRRAFHMTLSNYGIRMLWRLQHYRTHERSRHRALAWELCGMANVCEALWAVLLDDPTCPEGGVWSRRLMGTFWVNGTLPADFWTWCEQLLSFLRLVSLPLHRLPSFCFEQGLTMLTV